LRFGQENISVEDWLASVKVRDYLGDLSVDGRLKFNWAIKKEGEGARTEFAWSRIAKNRGSSDNVKFRIKRIRVISSLPTELITFQEDICSLPSVEYNYTGLCGSKLTSS
jgi:hypothetical protein